MVEPPIGERYGFESRCGAMNNNTATMVMEETEGVKPYGSRKRHKTKFNPNLCPELEMIGRHIVDQDGVCRYCQDKVE